MSACQGIDFRDPTKLGKGTARAYKIVRSVVSKLEKLVLAENQGKFHFTQSRKEHQETTIQSEFQMRTMQFNGARALILVFLLFSFFRHSAARDQEYIATHLLQGDKAYSAWKNEEAFEHFQQALALDGGNYEALWKTSRTLIDLGDQVTGEQEAQKKERTEFYERAEALADKAVKANPNDPWGYNYLAAAMGLRGLQLSKKKQIDMSKRLEKIIKKAIELDSNNDFGLHIYGRWHRRVAEIGGAQRFAARLFLFRKIPKGSFEESVEHFQRAIEINPTNIIHHLELGITYIKMKQWFTARSELETVMQLPVVDQDDPKYKETAARLLAEIADKN